MNILYIVSKLFTYIILPPGGFIVAMLLGLKKHLKWILLLSTSLLYLLSITPISNLLLKPLEQPYIHHPNKKAKLVVVLGEGVSPLDPIKTGEGTFKRVIFGLMIAKQHHIPMLFTGGSTKNPPDAILVKHDILNIEKVFGFRVETYYESRSLNTIENAKYTLKLVEKLNLPNEIYLVTSAYHMRRSEMIFKSMGFNVVPEAVDFLTDTRPYNVWDFFPHMSNLRDSYIAIHEYFGILEVYLTKWL